MVAMDTRNEYLNGASGALDDDQICVNSAYDSFLDNSYSLLDSEVSLTHVTNISDLSNEEFSYTCASMYQTTVPMTRKENNYYQSSDYQQVPDCDGGLDLGSRTLYYSEFKTDHHHLSVSAEHELADSSDGEPDLGSRTMYYSEFNTDHHHLSVIGENDSANSSYDSDCNIPFPRIVEGSEDDSSSYYSSSGSDSSSNDSDRKQNNGSFPQASSTMICDTSMDSLCKNSETTVKYGSNSVPEMSSTLIQAPKQQQNRTRILSKSEGHRSECQNELNSIFTWSIHDDGYNKGSIEELYLQKFHEKQITSKPPAPPKKGKPSKLSKSKEKFLSVDASISGIEPLNSFCDSICDEESMFDDENKKDTHSRKLPRTSTRIHLDPKFHSKLDFHCVPECDRTVIHKSEMSHISNKKNVIKKLKKFTRSFRTLDNCNVSNIQTLANL